MKNKGSEYNISEYGNWNVAADYANLKIMKFLYLSDEYEVMATFGTSSIIEDLNTPLNLDEIKLKGFRRLVKTISMLINNTIFAIRDKSDKEKFENWMKELKEINKIIPTLYRYKVNNITKSKALALNEERYERILERVIEIKMSINTPLNKNDLIFTHVEEFDPIAYEKALKEEILLG